MDIPVDAKLRVWLTKTAPDDLKSSLIGCELDQDEYPIARIVDVDLKAGVILVLDNGRRANLTQLEGALLDGRPGNRLKTSIENSRTPSDRREAEVRSKLRDLQVYDLRSADAEQHVLGFITSVNRDELPTESELYAFYQAMKPVARNYRRAVTTLQTLAVTNVQHNNALPSLHWQLAWLLKEMGRLAEAVDTAETRDACEVQGKHRSYLNTVKASALIQLGLQQNQEALLDRAKKALDVANAIDRGSEAVAKGYQTLKKAREELNARKRP